MDSWSIVCASEKQTLQLGEKLGRLLTQPTLILLQGDLGAGKTVFARGIARGLGVAATVPITSPTFTIMNHYPARLDLYHFDLYRISDPDELIELGFDDYAFGTGVALVEWPEKMDNPKVGGLWIDLHRVDDETRKIVFTATDLKSVNILTALQNNK